MSVSSKNIVVYSSASGGVIVQKNTTAMVNMVRTVAGKEPTVVYLDAEPAQRTAVWQKSGKKGIYPLLFVDNAFVGDVSPLSKKKTDSKKKTKN